MPRKFSEQGIDITSIKLSVPLMLVRMLSGLFVLDTCYALIIVLFLWLTPMQMHGWLLLFLLLLHTIKFIVFTVFLLRLITQWQGKTVLITSHHLYIDEGLVHANDRIYELAQIQAIKLNQSWLGKMLNFGDICITLGSRSFSEVLELGGVANPQRYVTWFSKYLQPAQ